MRTTSLHCCMALLMISPSWAAEASRVPLVAEQQTILHVGQIGVFQIPSKRRYIIHQSGDALTAINHAHQNGGLAFYRATRPGNETIILTPAAQEPGKCVSCVTQHFFITVVPKRK